MMRTDINLAIVAMVEDPKQVDNDNYTDNYCFEINENEPTQVVVRIQRCEIKLKKLNLLHL